MSDKRTFSAIMSAQSVSASGDLLEIAPAVNKPVAVKWVRITQEDSETSEQLPIELVRATTGGTGGTAVTPVPMSPGGGSFSGTVTRNSTAAASGTVSVVWREGGNKINGWDWLAIPTAEIGASSSALFVARLLANPGSALTLTATVVFDEEG
jgi:hypothetical protein